MGTFGRRLLALLALGTAARLVLLATTDGVNFDLESFRIVAAGLRIDGLDVYATVNEGDYPRWPYPPGYMPLVVAADVLADLVGVSITRVVRIWPIAADAAIAWFAQDFLGRRGATDRTRLAAAGLVALGPSFAAISGHHGQVDAVAILPAVAALWYWERADAPRRALVAGALIGLGGAVKTVPLLMVLALLPSVRSPREAITLMGGAGAVFVAFLLPFIAATPQDLRVIYDYRGSGGLGGLSLVAQPGLAEGWLGAGEPQRSALSSWLQENGGPFTVLGVLAVAAAAFRMRAEPVLAAVLIWLAIYVFGVNFFVQYLVWGLPFFIMAGFLREVAALQALLLAPTLLLYLMTSERWQVHALYSAPMIAAWAAAITALALLLRRSAAARDLEQRGAAQGCHAGVPAGGGAARRR